jgi:hypothetical protein
MSACEPDRVAIREPCNNLTFPTKGFTVMVAMKGCFSYVVWEVLRDPGPTAPLPF